MTNQWEFLQFGISCALFGVIWIIQLVHYPSFKSYEINTFSLSMRSHQDRISWVVIPLMLAELMVAAYLAYTAPSLPNQTIVGIVICIWFCTFTIQVPLHRELLLNGKNSLHLRHLVISNWIRTALWTLKLFIVFSTSIYSL